MELFESHFNNLKAEFTLYHNTTNDKYELFSNEGIPKHINYLTFRKLFESMKELKEPIILESGISSAGIKSTHLFNEYVRKYGGRFWSVDIDQLLVNEHKGNMCPATELICDDSISFFNNWSKDNKEANVIYLDSYDLDFYNPVPSGNHGLAEYKALLPVIKKDTLLLIDDTPINPYWVNSRGTLYDDMIIFYEQHKYMPGKGMYVLNEAKHADTLIHNYQILYKFN